jgi:hypothetical protein
MLAMMSTECLFICLQFVRGGMRRSGMDGGGKGIVGNKLTKELASLLCCRETA